MLLRSTASSRHNKAASVFDHHTEDMAERDWSIAPIPKPAAATFEKFGGGPNENGRRWLRRFLFHYDNATPAQLMSLIDIHLIDKAVEWADGNKDVAALLAAKDASNATVKHFQDLFNKRFDLSTTPQGPRAIAFREPSKERFSAPPSDNSQTTTEPVQQQSLFNQERLIRNQVSPEELEFHRRQAAESNIPLHSDGLLNPTVASKDHPSGTVGALKRGRSAIAEPEDQVTKKPRLEVETATASPRSANAWTQFASKPTFNWALLHQYAQETVEEYGARTLDLFTATGGLDRKVRKQSMFESQVDYLDRAVKSFCEGLNSRTLRDRMLNITKAKIHQRCVSLERTCATAHEFARQEAAGLRLSDEESHNRANAAVNRKMKHSVQAAKENEKKLHQPFQNNEGPPPGQHKTFDQAPKISGRNSASQSLKPVNSSQFKPADGRARESVHIKLEDSDSSVVSDSTKDSD